MCSPTPRVKDDSAQRPSPVASPSLPLSLGKKTRITTDLMRRLPKAELHKHLDGSVRPETILELGKEQGIRLIPELPEDDIENLRKLVCVDENCQSLVQYLRSFDITLKVLQKAYALTRVMYEVCEDSYKDGVKYLEIRFSPVLHVNEGLSMGAVMEAVCEGLALARYHFPIMANIIVCAMRQLSSKETENIAEIAWRYRHKGVCGFDLAGPEFGFSSKLHRAAFEIVRSKGIFCTLHSGEAAGWESIQDSIRYCGANRIGHGVHLIDNPKLLEYVVAHRIPIESCPTSNLQTKAVGRLADHPIRKFFDAGAIVVPCTDNTTVSQCTLSGEYMMLHEKFDFTVEEIVRLIDYGFYSAFVSSTEKRRLRADALHQCLRLLNEEGYDTTGIMQQEVYYRSIGVSFNEVLSKVPSDRKKQRQVVTKELLKALPKTDLHCRLDGSVSVNLLWKELNDAGIDLKAITGRTFSSPEELCEYLASAEENNLSHIAKDITKAALQKPGQLERAVEDVVATAVADTVSYMEMMVRPVAHTSEGLSAVTVLDIVCCKIRELMKKFPIKVGVVVMVSPSIDDPITFREMAQLCVDLRGKNNNIVCGFGIYGDKGISPESFRFFNSTFEFLKANHINVAMVAGLTGVDSILSAIHDGGASRISGAFQIHSFPRLMNYCASCGISVELSITPKLREHTINATFAGSPIRLFLDNDMPVVICSFRSLFIRQSRVDVLMELIEDCSFSLPEVLKLLSHGFRYNFQDSKSNEQLITQFWQQSKKYLVSQGLEDLFDVAFFPQ